VTNYYATFDDKSGEPLMLIRLLVDDANEEMSIERMTPDGTWQDDPSLIDELREPGVRQLEQGEVADVLEALGQQRELANDPEVSGEVDAANSVS
jgi:hypothetical protein